MTEKSGRESKIIFDQPSETDAFEAGGHQRSANSLANAIEQLSDQDGAIGLEGEWGSGKSTVIKLAEKVLTAGDQTSRQYWIFTFDLWAHQSDDFRRAFLEAFVDWLENNSLLKQKDADEARDTIRDRTKTIKHNNSRHYNVFGLFFILLAPLLPLAYTWLSPFAFNANISVPPVLGMKPPEFVLLSFTILYSVFLVRLFSQFFEFHRPTTRKFWPIKWLGWKNFGKRTSRAISMFTKDVEQEEITQNIRETDPTTIEFHNIFRNQLSKVQKNEKRIILVLDNIDRLAKNSVPTIWSEVRSLFAIGTSKAGIENSWVTAVVPYDKPFIVAAFATKHEGNGNDFTEVEVEIINKTFNRIIRVSPPVATDWRNFLQQNLDYAFAPVLNEQTSYRLFKILDHHLQQELKPPTPRLIINFVNEISTLWVQWGNEIPTESIALYVLHRTLIEKNPAALRNFYLTSNRYIHIANVENWQKDFAALAFNVSPSVANQILLSQPIARALSNAVPSDLLEISQAKGFHEILPDVLEERLEVLAKESAESLSNISRNIEFLNLEGELNKSVWRQLGRAIKYLPKFKLSEKNILNGLVIIVSRQEEPSFTEASLNLKEKISESADLTGSEPFIYGQDWLNGISDIGREISSRNGQEALKSFLRNTEIPSGPAFCLGVAKGCAQNEYIKFKDLSLKTPKGEIQDELGKAISNCPQDFLATLGQFEHLLDDSSRVTYIEKIAAILKTKEAIEEDNRENLLEALIRLSHKTLKSEQAKTILRNIVNDGTLLWHGYDSSQKKNFDTAGIVLWLIIMQIESPLLPIFPDSHPQLGILSAARAWYDQVLSSTENFNDGIINKLASCVSDYAGFSRWAAFAINENTSNIFFKEIFKEVVIQGNFQYLEILQIVSNYSSIRRILGEEALVGFLNKCAEWENSFKKAISGEKALNISTELINDIDSLGVDPRLKTILEIVDSYLKSLSQNDWEEALTTEDESLRLLIARRKTTDLTLPVDVYRPALMSHALKVLQGKIETKEYALDWKEVLFGLKPGNRPQLAKDIFNTLPNIAVEIKGAEHFIEIYGELAKEMPYTEDNTGKALDHIFSKLVYSEKEVVKYFLKSVSDIIRVCLEKAHESSKAGFEEAIESLEEKDNNVSQEWAAELRQIFRFEKKPSAVKEPSEKE